jgi:hypothetical protein
VKLRQEAAIESLNLVDEECFSEEIIIIIIIIIAYQKTVNWNIIEEKGEGSQMWL